MMTKKYEMAEWILDFFRKAKVAAGQIVLFRNLQFAQQQLNPKERSLYLNVMNELLENGYFTFEQEPVQCLRLSEKGYNYIYNTDATLDCCIDKPKTTEEDFRNIIALASTLVSLEAYADLLNYGDTIEAYNYLAGLDNKDNKMSADLKIETIKEYYSLIFKNVILTCRVILDVVDDELLDIVDGYVSQSQRCLSRYNIYKVPTEKSLADLIIRTKERLYAIGRDSMADNFNKYCKMIFV